MIRDSNWLISARRRTANNSTTGCQFLQPLARTTALFAKKLLVDAAPRLAGVARHAINPKDVTRDDVSLDRSR